MNQLNAEDIVNYNSDDLRFNSKESQLLDIIKFLANDIIKLKKEIDKGENK